MRGRSVLFATAAALLLATVPAAPGGATGGATGAATAAGPGSGGSAPAAEQALAEAVALMAPPGRRTSARGGGAGDAAPTMDSAAEPTLVLRDLRAHYRSLSQADQRTADRLLDRPTGLQFREPGVAEYGPGDTTDSTCPDLPSADLCVHWVTEPGSRHVATPDYVDTVTQVMDTVWRNTVDRLGYRAPLPDEGRPVEDGDPDQGPDQTLDVYLADLGGQYYGYCMSDDPDLAASRVSAFCVLDNDYDPRQFGGAAPIKSLRATAAHEFFHAVQFAYDFYEDHWMMESTAAWVEDEIFDAVNDNRQYLPSSQLRTPWVPMDCIARPNYGCDGNFPYGTWAFWRFLSDRLSPAVVRDTWERAAAPKVYSLKAMRGALNARHRDFGKTFADFGRATRFSKRMFSEGKTYPQARPFVLRPVTRSRDRGWLQAPVNHLAHEHVEFRTDPRLGRRGKLRLRLDLPFRARGTQVRVTLRLRNGRLPKRRATLNRKGDGTLVVPFNAGRVNAVSVTFTNASTRMRDCDMSGFGTTWSCGGQPRDEGLRFAFRATPFRR